MTERFSASVAARHMACPASANLDLAIPGWIQPARVIGGAADAGTAKHEMLEPIVALSTKDIDGFAKILRYIADLRATRRFKMMVEEMVEVGWLVTKPKTTVDYVLYTQDELHIIDYKWGKIPVEVIENVQLMYYARTFAALAPKARGVTVHILQPHADNYDSWYIDSNRLAQFEADALAAEQKILAKDTTFGPTDDGCKFCPASPHSRGAKGKPFCPAMMQIHYPKVVDEDAILGL